MKTIIYGILIIQLFSNNLNAQNEKNTEDFKIIVANINELGKYKSFVDDAITLLNEVFNSDEYRTVVLTKKFDWENLNGGYTEMTNDEVYEKLIGWNDSVEMKLLIKPRGLRLTAYLYGTIGVTNLNSNTTKTYRHWIDLTPENYQRSVVMYASHIAHEYCHQRGFTDKNDRPQCEFRDVVPYAIGDITCELINEMYKSEYDCDKCSKE